MRDPNFHFTNALAADTTRVQSEKGTEKQQLECQTGHGRKLHIFALIQNFPIAPSNCLFAPSRYTTWIINLMTQVKSATLLRLLAHHWATRKQRQRNRTAPVCDDSQQVSLVSHSLSHVRGLEEQGQIGSLGPVNQRAGYTHGSHYTYAFDSSLENIHTSQVSGSPSVRFAQDSNSYNTLSAKLLHIDVTVSAKSNKVQFQVFESDGVM